MDLAISISITFILILLFLLSLFYVLLKIKSIKKFKENKNYSLLVILFFIPILLNFFRFSNTSPHYFFMIYPLQFLFFGLFFCFIYNKYLRYRLYFIISFIFILILLGFNSYLLFNYINNNGAVYIYKNSPQR